MWWPWPRAGTLGIDAAQNERATSVTDRLRIVFFGTPEFAVPTLERLATTDGFDVALVVTQPDRRAGRGRRLEASPVEQFATGRALPIFQPDTLRETGTRAVLEAANADLFVVAAYGRILGPRTLAIPRLGCVNVHASLLPRYRGASPVAAAILQGEAQTGVSLMVMEPGLDTGPVVATSTCPIAPTDTTASLTHRLALVGAGLAIESIPAFAGGELSARPQPSTGASYARPLVKADGWLDWTRPASELERRVRAMWPWPRAWTTAGDDPPRTIQIHAVEAASSAGGHPGEVFELGPNLAVACGAGALVLRTVQSPGGRPMPGAALLAGRHLRCGDRLGVAGQPSTSPLVTPVAG